MGCNKEGILGAGKRILTQWSSVVCACAVMDWIHIQDDDKNPYSLLTKAQLGEFKRQVPEHKDGAEQGAEETAPEMQNNEEEENAGGIWQVYNLESR